MKIGIISKQRVHNYGSFLQAWALKKTLECGGNCSFIDIRTGRQLQGNAVERKSFFSLLLLRIRKVFSLKHIRLHSYYNKRGKMFDKWISQLGIDENASNKKFDLVVIGSDEVFNFSERTYYGFSTQLFGEGINAEKIITYAGTFASAKLSDIDKYNVRAELENSLKNISAISVRDAHSLEMMKTLTDKEISICLDPVFIYNFDNDIILPSVSDYIVVYSYQNRISDTNEIAAIKQFAKKEKKRLISLGSYIEWCDENIICSPFELLGFFKNASYIITDTFHGTVISIKYNKAFAVFVRNKQIGEMTANSNKLLYLLNQFLLTERNVDNPKNLENIITTSINYTFVNEKLQAEIDNSLEFILKNMK